jgi:hypothetical protein
MLETCSPVMPILTLASGLSGGIGLAAATAGGAVELLLDRPEQPLEASTASTATIVTPRIIPLPSTLIVTLPRARVPLAK